MIHEIIHIYQADFQTFIKPKGGYYMVKRTKRWVVFCVLTALLCQLIPVTYSRAATGNIRYYLSDNRCYYTNSMASALNACNKEKAGRIEVLADCNINIPSVYEAFIGETTTVTIAEGVTVTIGRYGLPCYGKIEIYGTLDLVKSEGILSGDGAIDTKSIGQLIRPAYTITKTDETCFEAPDIHYGQSLGEVTIAKERTNWKSSVEGTWCFTDSSRIPEPGTYAYDITFVPRYPLMYGVKTFSQAGKITVKASKPHCEEYEAPVIHVGETLVNESPKVKYTDAYSGKEVKGTFSYENPQEIYTQTGEQMVLTRFEPFETDKYETIVEYKKIKVLRTDVEVSILPVIRKNGQVGQSLEEISFVSGVCVNPYSGEIVPGKWEWKDASQPLTEGDKDYKILFLPDTGGYNVLETSVNIHTEKVKEIQKVETEKGETTTDEENLQKGTNESNKLVNDSEETSDEKPTYVITQLVSRISTISKPVSVKRVTIKKAKRSGRKIKLSWKKISGANYEVQYAVSKKMKKAKKKTVKKTSLTLSKLKKGKKYYIRVRAWKRDSTKKIYGKWSAKKHL